ncbi:MAG: hypothetical protein MJZ35_02565, partial [Bacteroidaceae bacterium]|nr:hypothetical protein [Bacteroidaceae bacterium]
QKKNKFLMPSALFRLQKYEERKLCANETAEKKDDTLQGAPSLSNSIQLSQVCTSLLLRS